MRTSAAWNIDFGEAEADERSVNLTRFELFRPETREFFLRDAGRFSFGGLDESAVMSYYSRRVGIDADGRARGLDAGLKLAGSVAGVDFGAFGARVAGGPTAPGMPDQAAADVAVLRVARPVGLHHRAGLIATRGNPMGTPGSSLEGIDYQFRDTAWQGGKTLEVHGWAMRSANDDVAGGSARTGSAWGASLHYPNVGPMAEMNVQRIGPGFDPALGYLAEDNVLRSHGTAGWWHRTPEGVDIIPALDWDFRRTLDGQERTVVLNPEVTYTSPAGDSVTIETLHERDRLSQGFAPVPPLTVPAGSYRWDALYAVMSTSESRPVHASAEFRAGGYYGGARQDQGLSLGWKPGPRWGLRIEAARNAIRLPSGRFTVKVATLRLEHTPDTRSSQSVQLQWDNISQSLGASMRLRWRLAPATDLVFALDRLGYTGERRLNQEAESRAMLKVAWNLER